MKLHVLKKWSIAILLVFILSLGLSSIAFAQDATPIQFSGSFTVTN
ncbi:hypothetical protein [Caldicellulosiruptor naganoensis]|uniref:Uncharacterized protein n=1 Tax=Caldicellulosiruptor naganoensis TaxID=29324 RepID=A0ABY7BHM3_9FIRM|nr:hypothetical protein [Caldicellulosiruptor naganoensis]WAM32333.1 hypothetical protein OTJ99_000867 [Caldicellulosiruptor naganoensis]